MDNEDNKDVVINVKAAEFRAIGTSPTIHWRAKLLEKYICSAALVARNAFWIEKAHNKMLDFLHNDFHFNALSQFVLFRQ